MTLVVFRFENRWDLPDKLFSWKFSRGTENVNERRLRMTVGAGGDGCNRLASKESVKVWGAHNKKEINFSEGGRGDERNNFLCKVPRNKAERRRQVDACFIHQLRSETAHKLPRPVCRDEIAVVRTAKSVKFDFFGFEFTIKRMKLGKYFRGMLHGVFLNNILVYVYIILIRGQ